MRGMFWGIFSTALLLASAACSSDDSDVSSKPSPRQERRTKIGKADTLSGKCQDGALSHCGGKSPGACWCDASCVEWGDCCADAAASCGVAPVGQCPVLHCYPPVSNCPGGVKKDSQGCETCECDGPVQCPTITCATTCPNGFKKDANGCDTCQCKTGPVACPSVLCFPTCAHGSKSDENGCETCECLPPPADSCVGQCGAAAGDGDCYCDAACSGLGDCCSDYQQACHERVAAAGACIKSSNDACATDADCTAGGCGGELCFNPAKSETTTDCSCSAPTNVKGCGCVKGQCTWFN